MAELRSSKTKEELSKEFRRHEILEAARRVIGSHGIAEASMERIAHEAEVAKGTIYLYYKNRDALLIAVAEQAFNGVMEISRNATAQVEGAAHKLRALFDSALRHTAEHQALMKELFDRAVNSATGTSPLDKEFARHADAYVKFISEIVDEGIASGEFRQLSSSRVARLITEGVRGVHRDLLRDSGGRDFASEVTDLMDFFLHGIAARKS